MSRKSSNFRGTRAETLVREARACTLCAPYLPLGPRPVFQFNPKARILLVGQAPGKRAHEAGLPFNDPSGDRLRRWLGVTREQFYDEKLFAIMPMGFCYPGTGKGGDLPPRPECAATWRKPLLALLPRIELTLLMGQFAIAWHLPQPKGKSLTETVEDWKRHWPKLLVLPHPSPRNMGWLKRNDWFERDVIPQLQKRIAKLI